MTRIADKPVLPLLAYLCPRCSGGLVDTKLFHEINGQKHAVLDCIHCNLTYFRETVYGARKL